MLNMYNKIIFLILYMRNHFEDQIIKETKIWFKSPYKYVINDS